MTRYNVWGIILIFLFFPITGLAQQAKCNVIGRVLDEKQAPVSYASVAIYSTTIPLTGGITDDDGRFSLKIEQADTDYRLVVKFIGYDEFEKSITPNGPRIDMGVIVLKESAISLNEVVVSAKEVAQKSAIEHTTINAASNIASNKGSAIDILRTSSSVNISNDEISIRGNSNILVLMDGVPITITDLSTIPAANIKSIKVITNPDASHDAGGTGGIINIISKRSKVEGFSGIIATNYGLNHFVTGNVAFSYNKPKTLWRFSYNTKYEDDIIRSTLYREIKALPEQTYQQIKATRYTFNNNLSLGADFRINAKDRISIDAKCILPRLNIEQELHNTFTDKEHNREEFRHNDVTWNRENIDVSVAYTRVIDPEVSDVTIKGAVSKIWGHRPSYYSVDGTPTNHSISGGSPWIPTLQADYKYKFKRGAFSSGVKLTYRRNDIYHQFYTKSGDAWEYSEILSNDLLHKELVPAAYVMFSSRVGKKFSYKVGLRGEYCSVELNSIHDAIDERKNSFFLAPSLSGIFVLSEKEEVALAFSRRVGRPTYPQLTPYRSMVDATTYEQGNIYLQSEKSTKLDLSYNLRREHINLFANGYVNYTSDYISQITTLDEKNLVTTYVNAESDIKTGIELSLRITLAEWMNFSIGANTYYASTEGIYEDAEIDNEGWTNNSNFMLNFVPWKRGEVQFQYFLTTPQYYPQLTTSLTHQMNIGIKQRLLKGAMTCSLLVTDLFHTAKWEVASHDNLFALTNTSKNKSRMLWIGISYNFNSFKQKVGQKSESDRSLIKFGM